MDPKRFSPRYSWGNPRSIHNGDKVCDSWKETDWQTALNYAFEGLKTVINKDGVENVGALVSPSATVEETYLLQKLMRAIGSNNIDHRLYRCRSYDYQPSGLALQCVYKELTSSQSRQCWKVFQSS